MPGRNYHSSNEYRFGFNGKENDKDWGNQLIQDYGFRLYNPSIGKFLSVDPLAPDYPFYSPYHFAGNSPIAAIDLDGSEPQWVKELLSLTADLAPGVSTAKSIDELRTGIDPLTGAPVSRIWAGVGLIPGGKIVKRVWGGLKWIGKGIGRLFKRGGKKVSKGLVETGTPLYGEAAEFIDEFDNLPGSQKPPTQFHKMANPFEAEVATALEEAFPNKFKVNQQLKGKTGKPIDGEIDIDFDNISIEVHAGKGKGKVEQILDQQKLTGKEVVLFAKNTGKAKLGIHVRKNLEENGIRVFTKMDDLIDFIKSKQNNQP